MKYLLVILTLATFSVSASEYNPLQMTGVTTISPFISPFLTTMANGGNTSIRKEAYQFIEDSQGYIQTGSVTPLLESKMNIMRSVNQELSDEEIVDGLLEAAQDIIK